MLIAKNLASQSEPITKYNNYEKFEEVNGSLELSFSSFFHEQNPGHELIAEESIIEKDGYEFRVKQLAINRHSKQSKALSIFFDLVGKRKEDIFGGTKTFNEFASWLFNGSGWTFENVDVLGSRLMPNFGDANIIALTNQLTATFKCEYQILPNMVVKFATQVGPDNDAQYRYGLNIKALSKKVDTTKLRTRIKGIGGNGLEVVYTSPNAAIFGIIDAETIKDERFTVTESLLERIKQDLIDYPEVTIELDAIELQQKEIGERVWLIYEPLNIEFQTRVLSKVSRIPETKSSVVIGNTIPRSLSDILTDTKVEIDLNKKQTQSKFDQTNEKFNFEVERVDGDITEAKADFQIIADGITGTVESLTTDTAAQILASNEYAAQQALNAKDDANVYTDTTLFPVVTRVTESESLVEQLAGSITSKVNVEIFETGIADAKLYADTKSAEAETAAKTYSNLQDEAWDVLAKVYADGIVTDEEQARITDVQNRLIEAKEHADTTAEIAEQAAKDHANGLVGPVIDRVTIAESVILQLGADIDLKANISVTDSMTTRLGSAEVNISGLYSEISSKASIIVTDALGTRATTAEQNISALNGSVSSKVETSDYNGNTVMSMFNQTATTILMDAKNINMMGIVQVANTLNIGNSFLDSTTKSIRFRGSTGGVHIVSTAIDRLSLQAQYLNFDSSYVIIPSYSQVEFNNAAVTGLTANDSSKFGGLYPSSYSVSGHQHSDYDYIKSSSSQSIQLGIYTSGKKLNLYLGGSLVGSIPYT